MAIRAAAREAFVRARFGSAALAVLFVIAASGELGRAADPAASCEAARLVGTATLSRDGRTIAIAPGSKFTERDEVATARDSRLEIACADGARLVLGADSRMRLTRLIAASAQPSGLVELLLGIARFALPAGHRWERFDVVTRTAVASVRSTEWIVEAVPERSSVFVVAGGVLVSGRATQSQVFLPPGFGSDVGAGPAPLQSTVWGRARVEDVLARTALP